MPMITVEVHHAGERLHELADAVLRGQEVMLTHFGEPVALAHFRGPPGEAPPPWARSAILEILTQSLEHLRERHARQPRCMN